MLLDLLSNDDVEFKSTVDINEYIYSNEEKFCIFIKLKNSTKSSDKDREGFD